MTAIGAMAQKSLPYSYGFEDNDLSVDGWTSINESSANASEFGIIAAAKRTGDYGFRFSSYSRDNTSYNQYLISPELDAASSVIFQFYYAANSVSGTEIFKVGYSTTNADVASFTFGSEISTNNTSWTLSEEFTFPTGTKYVAIYYYSDYQYRLYVDDFSFTNPSSCPKPTAVTADNLTSTTADIAWTPAGEETTWTLKYGPAGFDVETEGTAETISGTPEFSIENLTANTAYEVYVKAVCSESDESDWKSTSFRTACAILTVDAENPYTEGFESTDASEIPDCWDRIVEYSSYGSTYPYVYSSSYSAHNGNKFLYMYAYPYSSVYENIIALPLMNEINTLQISLWAKAGSTIPEAFEIGYIKNGVFTSVKSVTLTTSYQQFVAYLNEAPADAERIAIRAYHSTTSITVYVDDIEVSELPSCITPENLLVSNITTASASVAWTDVLPATAWQYQLNDGEIVDAEANPINLTELTANTEYIVKVRTACGEGEYSEWATTTFTTLCEAITVDAENPFTEDFTGLTSQNFPPQCWAQERTANGTGSGTDYPNGAWALNTYSQGTNSNPPMAQLRDTKAGSRHNLVTAPLSMASGNYVVSVRVYRNASGDNHTVEGINLYLSKTYDLVSAGNDAVDLGFISRNYTVASDINSEIIGVETAQGWYTYKVPFTISTDGVYYVIFEGRNNYGSSTYMDDVVIRPISTGAEILTYSLPTQTEDDAIFTSGDDEGTIDVTVTYTTNFDEDLNPTYTISEYAEISAPVITGEGDSRRIAYTVTAEAGNSKDWTVNVTKAPVSRDAFITGFTFAGQKAGTTAEIVSDAEYNTYTVHAVAEWNVDLTNIAPEITVSPAATITNPSGAQDFTNAVTYTILAEDLETSHDYIVTIINDPDACINPTDLEATDITAHTATLNWVQGYTETSYLVKITDEVLTSEELEAATDLAFDQTVNALTVDVDGLEANTEYYVYIQSNCENAEGWSVDWFRTECDAFSAPFTESFNNDSETIYCWTTISNNEENAGRMGIYNNVFRFSSWSSADDYNQYLISPELSLTEDAVLTFDYAKSNSSDETFQVMTSSTTNDISSFEILGSPLTATSTSYTPYIANIPAGTKYIAINYFSESDKYYLYIDNFKVNYLPRTIVASVDNDEHGTIYPDGNVEVEYGESQSFTITPVNSCYRIASVLVDGVEAISNVDENGVYTFDNVNAAHTIAATFAFNTYNITTTVEGNGSINGEGTVNCGDNKSYIVAPANTCYRIASFTVDGVDAFDDLDENGVYAMQNITADHALAATFEQITYTITATAGENGTITANDGNGNVANCGENKSFTIAASPCYQIASVLVDDVDVTATVVAANGVYTFENVMSDHTIEAAFEQITYTFTVTADANGSITANDGNGNVANCGENKAFTIAANDCYHIASVIVDDNVDVTDAVIAANGVYTFENVNAAHTIAATFAINTYAITTTVEGNGTISGESTASCGESKSYTIAPANTCYRIASFTVDGVDAFDDLDENGVYAMQNITADHALAATFEQITYTITATAGENGTITETSTVNCGDNKEITITPANCYRIASVLVDDVDVTATVVAANGVYTFENVIADHNIAATFEQITYTITTAADANGTITETSTVNCGANKEITITANAGYRIASVIVDETENVTDAVIAANGVYTFENVTADHTIAATFELIPANTYTITATAGENGTITPNGEVTVYEGDNQNFTIVAAAGYRIASVMVDSETEVVAQLVDGVYTFENVTADHTINATFEAIPTYTITATAGENGTITPDGEVEVAEGAEQAFAIVANEGYRIASVMVDETENVTEQLVEGVYTFTNVAANHTIAATFEAIPVPTYTITATAGENGSINPEGEVTVTEGENKEFTIVANEGYRIASVMVDETENVTEQLVDGVYTFVNVTANHTIAATFEAIPTYTITATAGEGGSINPEGEVTVTEGESQLFTIIANEGYRIASVMVDETEDVTAQLVDGVYTFTDVNANHTINATFAILTYTITATAGENGTITPSDAVVVNYGATQTFAIAANDGFRTLSVLVDGAEAIEQLVDGVYTFENVTADHTIAATFVSVDATVYTITATASDNGTITPSGTLGVVEGSDMAFTIAANAHCRIVSVMVDETENVTEQLVDGVYTFENVTANHTIAATFEHITYTITATAGENGSITPNGEVVVNEAESQTFAIAANEGYRIASVLVDDVEAINDVVEGVYTFANVTANHTIAASFEAIPTYTITATAGEGGSINPAEVTVVEGGSAEFTIAANEGYRIASVMVDAETENEANVTEQLVEGVYTFANVTANHTIAATFEEIPATIYTITATAGANGTINPAGEVTAEEGEDVEFTITANEGYRIASVIVDADTDDEEDVTDALENGVYTFENVTANHTIHATFEDATVPNTHTVTLTVGEHGTVSATDADDNEIAIVDGAITVNHGDDLYLEITPDENYKIETLTVNGVEYELDEEEELEFTLPMLEITEDMTVSVTFTSVIAAEMFEAGSMTVYPNPNNGMFSIDFSNIEGDATYEIISASGAVVETRDINVMNGETMNFSHDLRPGTYFVRIINGDKVYVEQIVVE